MPVRSRVHALLVSFGAHGAALGVALGVCACTETLDAGSTRPHGILPVDERNPLVLLNDGPNDNWQGEYAVLLANGGGPPLAAIVVNASPAWPDLDANVSGWRALTAAARDSGLDDIPDPVTSVGGALMKPDSGRVEDTVPNRSEGARVILEVAAAKSLPYRPIVVATGTRLTDVADAYLLDPSVSDKLVVVASLGSLEATGAAMSNPNGEMDPWADYIVSTRLEYVQVSAFYDQRGDVTDGRVSELPNNPFGAWMAQKQPEIYSIAVAADQVSVLASGYPAFVAAAEHVTATGSPSDTGGPGLVRDARGKAWLVTETKAELAANRLWSLLSDASTFSH